LGSQDVRIASSFGSASQSPSLFNGFSILSRRSRKYFAMGLSSSVVLLMAILALLDGSISRISPKRLILFSAIDRICTHGFIFGTGPIGVFCA
jgi:hypothetical protein